jgi:hypothetical protein
MAAWRDGFLLRCLLRYVMLLALCIFTLGLPAHEEDSTKARSDSGMGL